jgi:ESCRT-II complex subunit VPS25
MIAHESRLLSSAGRAAWLDKDKSRAMILWKTHAEWADTIYSWARGFGLNDSVLAVDDLSTSDDVEGTGGAPHTLLLLNIVDTA